MPYRPYYIEQLTAGLDISLEPRLIQGFSSMLNCRVHKGRLIKRPGYAVRATTGQSNPIVGFAKAYRKGPAEILVADTKRLYRLEPVLGTTTELTSGDTFTGADFQYFQFTSWLNKTYMSNFSDALYVYDGDADTVALVDTGDTTVTRAQHIFIWKNRLHLINVVIDGNDWKPQRHMWSDVLGGSDPTKVNFSTDNWVDGEFQGEDDVPMLVRFFRGVPYVFFKQFLIPIRSQRVESGSFFWGDPIEQWGSITQNFGVRTKNGIMFLNQRNIDLFDGYRGQAIDLPSMRDFVDTLDNRKWHYVTGTEAGEDDYVYMTYAENGQSVPNKILEICTLDNTFSTAGIPLNAIYGFDGFYAPESLIGPNVYDDDYAVDGDFDASTLDLTSEAQLRTTATTFGGDTAGNILDLNSGTDFGGSTFPVEALSARINPFNKEGLQAVAGRIEFLVTTDATASYTLSMYKDQEETTPFKTFTLSCANDSTTKVKHWVPKSLDGVRGDTFRFKLSHTAKDNSPVIHAIRIWLDKGGPIWEK